MKVLSLESKIRDSFFITDSGTLLEIEGYLPQHFDTSSTEDCLLTFDTSTGEEYNYTFSALAKLIEDKALAFISW